MDNNRKHYFHPEIAEKIGVDCAIILKHIIFWIAKNNSNDINNIKGKTWTYFTVSDLREYFPYYTISQLRRILKQLIDKKIILKDNFNKIKYDRTLWYSLVDEVDWLVYYNPIEDIEIWSEED